ncbi:cytochrome c, mono-and diheme variants family [Methyloglobulus morosus KoM1]|uniref:Cytochrome c, mono-and diheme variants family n=1 Tax=Methyloglobulus morosus KoM1 TaxID=1116472 RepID=V5DHQ3_9GAMM|nr:sulfur oxidation c-type cytochrome SoxX [Methyloglobulus morosus]ESS66946.1 cytochrome c, mono-and diheme variants family [Methyloglobulus morosus KoM1]
MKIIAISLVFLLLQSCTPITQTPIPSPNVGKQIAFSRDKGNCLACHAIEDGEFPGNIGPALKNLPTRFKNKQQLREQIWDATQFNPETSMPPFGKNKILSEAEIDLLVDYLWELK